MGYVPHFDLLILTVLKSASYDKRWNGEVYEGADVLAMSLFQACRCGHNQVSSSFEDEDSELISSEDSQQDSVAMKKMKSLETKQEVENLLYSSGLCK